MRRQWFKALPGIATSLPRSRARAFTRLGVFGLTCVALSHAAVAAPPSCSLAGVSNDGAPSGRLISIDQDSLVASTFCGGSAGYTSEAWLATATEPILLGVGHETADGSTVDLGYFAAGTELVFFIYVRNTGDTFYSGPASRNPDGVVHAAVDKAGEDLWRIGFEDLFGGGDLDYDDINLLVSASAEVHVDQNGDGVDEVVRFDSDGDGLYDDEDSCPFEDASGYDPDGDGCVADTDGDGVKDNRDRCPGQDDTIDANGNGRPDCRETGAGTVLTFSGTVTGYCYSLPDYTYSDISSGFELEVSYPDGLDRDYGYTYSDGSGYHVDYGEWYSDEIFQTLRLQGTPLASSDDAIQRSLYAQDYGYYGYDSDYFGGYWYGAGYATQVNWYLSGGNALSTGEELPVDLQLSDFSYNNFYYYENSATRYCSFSGTFTGLRVDSQTQDADGDGVSDTDDACPGHDDRIDTDTDGTADGCDACPVDAGNDSDGDGSCDSADLCPNDPANDADGDGICADDELPGCALDAANDADGDGVCAPADICPNDAQNDADGDGLCADVDEFDTCNDHFDADADGTPDDCDVCPQDFYNDSDGDGACDSDDACPFDQNNDSDGDGSCDSADVCPHDAQNDVDGDGACGDVDACPVDPQNDADGDGICEVADNCDTVANSNQSNVDGDAYGDACEPDADGDLVVDDYDNCDLVPNSSQADADQDGIGDACEADTDHDGKIDDIDQCPGTPSGTVVDGTGCSIDQRVPCNSNWKNHGAYVSALAKTADAFVAAGLITQSQKDQIVSAGAQSSCGDTKKK